jgi:hypothetical protein
VDKIYTHLTHASHVDTHQRQVGRDRVTAEVFTSPSKTYVECKKMVNTEDMGIASLVNILGRKYI